MTFLFFAVLLYVTSLAEGNDIVFINQLRQFGTEHQTISLVLALVLFSMAGIPPLAGFFGKSLLLLSAFRAGKHCLVILGLVMNVISAFYYLRIVKCIFFEAGEGPSFVFFTGPDAI